MYSSIDKNRPFNYLGVYPCPVCRLNQLQAMPLMDAMACDCCRHIFVADLDRQQLKMIDRHPPLTWHWTGKTWKGAHVEEVNWGWTYWIFALGFVVLPTSLIGIAVYTFPPEPNTPLSWLPFAWIGLTFLAHLVIIGWLVTEFYQFPVRIYLRAIIQKIFGR